MFRRVWVANKVVLLCFVRRLSARGSAESMVSGSMPSGTTAGISLGVLLGAGSFGRVYKARWHSNDVAGGQECRLWTALASRTLGYGHVLLSSMSDQRIASSGLKDASLVMALTPTDCHLW